MHKTISMFKLTWGQLKRVDFMQVVEAAYSETVQWLQSLPKIPYGRARKDFVPKIAHLLWGYAEASALEPLALKAAMLMSLLLLQKPSSSSKTKYHCKHLSQQFVPDTIVTSTA